MTTPTGPILFNNSTGSDTAASGLGPATAVTGTGASLNATSTVDVSADAPDLSGVAAGHLLWVLTSSGRQFSVIASVDNTAKTITCDDAFAVTESGKTWAVGGKRSGLTDASSRGLFNSPNAKTDWQVEFEYTGTDYTYSSLLTVSPADVSGYMKISGTGDGLVVLDYNSTLGGCIQGGWVWWDNLRLQRSRIPGDFVGSVLKTSGDTILTNCELAQINGQFRGPFSYGLEFNANRRYFVRCYNSSFIGNLYGVMKNSGSEDSMVQFLNCTFTENIFAIGARGKNFVVKDSVFYGNTSKAISLDYVADGHSITGNIFYGSNEEIDIAAGETSYGVVAGNIFSSISGTAVTVGTSARAFFAQNAFYNCGTNYSGSEVGVDDVALSADPFVDAASGDFNLNVAAGGGALLRSASSAMPGLANTTNHPFRQWVSDDFGGGSVIVVEDD